MMFSVDPELSLLCSEIRDDVILMGFFKPYLDLTYFFLTSSLYLSEAEIVFLCTCTASKGPTSKESASLRGVLLVKQVHGLDNQNRPLLEHVHGLVSPFKPPPIILFVLGLSIYCFR